MTNLTTFFQPSKLVDNLNKLPLGSILSYKEICFLLEEKEVAGNSRIRQAEEWSSYMVLEKVGRKFLIKQVFSPQEQGIEHRFNKDERHILNSALLLQEYLLDRSLKFGADDTEIEGIESVTLFTKDVASICGYVPSSYYENRIELKTGNIVCTASPALQMYFASIVKTEVSETVRRLLTSLEKKLLIVVKKVHVGVNNMSQEELSDAQVVLFNSVKLAYAQKKGFTKKLNYLNTSTWEFRRMLKEAGLEFINVFTAYRITYKVDTLKANLEQELKEQASIHNNRGLKTRVKTVAGKEDKMMEEGLFEAKTFKNNALYRKDTMMDIDWLLETFLTVGRLNWEEEVGTTSL